MLYVIKQSAEDHYIFMNKYFTDKNEAYWWLVEFDLQAKGWAIYNYGE